MDDNGDEPAPVAMVIVLLLLIAVLYMLSALGWLAPYRLE